jgi:transposase
MLTPGVVLHHDNTRPHTYTAIGTRAFLEHFDWEFFEQPHYSPCLTPSDYNLFIYLNNRLRSQRFNNNEKLTEGV